MADRREFICEFCEQSFASSENLKLHIATQHTSTVTKIICPLWPRCRGAHKNNGHFGTVSNLRVHYKRFHTRRSFDAAKLKTVEIPVHRHGRHRSTESGNDIVEPSRDDAGVDDLGSANLRANDSEAIDTERVSDSDNIGYGQKPVKRAVLRRCTGNRIASSSESDENESNVVDADAFDSIVELGQEDMGSASFIDIVEPSQERLDDNLEPTSGDATDNITMDTETATGDDFAEPDRENTNSDDSEHTTEQHPLNVEHFDRNEFEELQDFYTEFEEVQDYYMLE